MIFPRNFPRSEMIASSTALRHGIENEPDTFEEANLFRVAAFLQVLRDRLRAHYGHVIYINVTSGFRCLALNRKIGSVDHSYHVSGLAADFHATGISVHDLALFVHTHMQDYNYDKVILEHNAWVHVQLPRHGKTPRLAALSVSRKEVDGEMKNVYRHGIVKAA